MSKSDRERMFGETTSGYLWCLHCGRTYTDDEYRTEINPEGHMMEMCYYQDCDGDAVADALDWDNIKSANSAYPDIPEEGVVYSQYG